jgi:hypothetical protein
VVVVVFVVVLLVAAVVVVVVELPQDDNTREITRKQVSSVQIAAFFNLTSYYFRQNSSATLAFLIIWNISDGNIQLDVPLEYQIYHSHFDVSRNCG